MTHNLVDKLKELVDKNGPDYLHDRPYETYQALIEADLKVEKMAGAILMALVRGIDKNAVNNSTDSKELSELIQDECCFNKRMADQVAVVFLDLYSKDNVDEWKEKEMEGWKQFSGAELHVDWNGDAVWEVSNGYVACHYNAGIDLEPLEGIKPEKELARKLSKNPYMKLEEIQKFYQKSLTDYLDMEFEDYCTCDDYYQPVVEDFEIEYHLKNWAGKHGFELINYEGDGDDDGYEPSFGHW